MKVLKKYNEIKEKNNRKQNRRAQGRNKEEKVKNVKKGIMYGKNNVKKRGM